LRIAVSNIAWPANRRDEAYAALARRGVDGIEIAPGLLFPDAENSLEPDEADVDLALKELADAGLHILSMQSLLFGAEDVALFGSPEQRARFENAMTAAIAFAGRLGIPHLVFGSPRQRNIPSNMSDAEALEVAQMIFKRLGDRAEEAGARISMESNPAAYGTNFLTHFSDSARFVQELDHPAISLILDMGAMHMNDQAQQLDEIVRPHASRLAHVHISEPFLAPAPAETARAVPVFDFLRDIGYEGAVSIEMKATQDDPVHYMENALDRLLAAASGEKARLP